MRRCCSRDADGAERRGREETTTKRSPAEETTAAVKEQVWAVDPVRHSHAVTFSVGSSTCFLTPRQLSCDRAPIICRRFGETDSPSTTDGPDERSMYADRCMMEDAGQMRYASRRARSSVGRSRKGSDSNQRAQLGGTSTVDWRAAAIPTRTHPSTPVTSKSHSVMPQACPRCSCLNVLLVSPCRHLSIGLPTRMIENVASKGADTAGEGQNSSLCPVGQLKALDSGTTTTTDRARPVSQLEMKRGIIKPRL